MRPWDRALHPPSWLLCGVLLLAACGSTTPIAPDECLDAPRFAALRQGVVERVCIQCHSETKSGQARNGAPEGQNYDRLELFQDKRFEFADAITSGRMPPATASSVPPTTASERSLAAAWRACDYPP